ncbi:cupin domain-containing protein [Paenibacillus allorhizosphaerae]|uniref:JmjC domain-containing protein n=1 Tax=Paenibacillus allorhizosphaerae TaxID=2849866 RepID=A0ABN7TG52_9BACL|nr:cupin domain-containing protein [Paenibacillus allorhizosphaerae]CAG7629939.1 hypothetical protein PAECIP111802_01603 [Paenibacillus allorhizosphaerae]
MNNFAAVVTNSEIPVHKEDWGTLQWLISGRGGTSETMTIGRVTFNPGRGNPQHMHPNCTEVLHVVSGVIRHTLPGGEMVVMNPGDSIVIPQGVWHHAENMQDTEAVVMVVFDSAWRDTIGESVEMGQS